MTRNEYKKMMSELANEKFEVIWTDAKRSLIQCPQCNQPWLYSAGMKFKLLDTGMFYEPVATRRGRATCIYCHRNPYRYQRSHNYGSTNQRAVSEGWTSLNLMQFGMYRTHMLRRNI